MKETQSKHLDLATDDISLMQFIITVPAIYTDNAKQMMKEWMNKALQNISKSHKVQSDQIVVALEPECASMSVLHDMFGDDIKSGTEFILADIGGGTADICVHKCTGKNKVKEIDAVSGDAWGAEYITDQFENLLCDMFGKDIITEFKQTHKSAYIELIDAFQRKKHEFELLRKKKSKSKKKSKKQKPKFHSVTLPKPFVSFIESKHESQMNNEIRRELEEESDEDSESEDVDASVISRIVTGFAYKGEIQNKGMCKIMDDTVLRINVQIWCDMFDHVVSPLIDHIKSLLSNNPGVTHLCCVGGASASLYIQSEFRNAFKTECPNLQFIFPTKPLLRVVDGAVRFGIYRRYVTHRIMKYTYGVRINWPIEQAKAHPNISTEHIEQYKVLRYNQRV